MVKCYLMNAAELPDPQEAPEALEHVPVYRREKTMRLRMPEDRKLSLAAGLLLTQVLPEHHTDPTNIEVDENGHPVIEGLFFNLSHSGDYAALTVSDRPVGCDLERMRERKGGIAGRFYSERENCRLKEAAGREKEREEFYRIWTARESYSKMTGEGLRLAFSAYETERIPETGRTGKYVNNKKVNTDIGLTGIGRKGDTAASENIPLEMFARYRILRETKKEDCLIWQSLIDDQYVFSVCGEDDAQPSLEYRRALI